LRSLSRRSFELRAALSLAKLYRAANRDADVHAVLAPAVEGFPPTEQFPELAEALTLSLGAKPLDRVLASLPLGHTKYYQSISQALPYSQRKDQ
jgi:hypothetical protein